MASGGARVRSGPAPDPNALRRDRKDDKAWIDLPVEPLVEVPEYPLAKVPVYFEYFVDKQKVREIDDGPTEQRWDTERAIWAELWQKPQAHMWAALGLKWQVAAYVRAYVESTGPESNSGLKTAVLRQEAELGLFTVGMASLRWKFAVDELSVKRADDAPKKVVSARDRMKALNG